ncbi:MAG: NUDIX hydrolase [Candidatus Dojkabacteria bacterium]|jgi:8-oxo-dGTP pyrophosphatase MutT (NUDIX family)|nr:NUDIX hydrolase [Candidatus Dojkabacteria bacterium]
MSNTQITEQKYSHIVSVIIVIRCCRKYFLVKRHKNDAIFPGKWQSLGGKIEAGERVEDAVIREVREESGIRLDRDMPLTFIQSYSWLKDENSVRRMGLVFMASLEKIPGKVVLSDELEEYVWCTYKEAAKLDSIGMNSATGTIAQLKIAENMR